MLFNKVWKGIKILRLYDPFIEARSDFNGSLIWKAYLNYSPDITKKHIKKLKRLGWEQKGPIYFFYNEYKHKK